MAATNWSSSFQRAERHTGAVDAEHVDDLVGQPVEDLTEQHHARRDTRIELVSREL